MNIGELKFYSVRLFDSFGFGSTALILSYFLFFKDFPEFMGMSLGQVPDTPSALTVPIATALVFFIHMLGRGVMAMGSLFLMGSTFKNMEIEMDLALVRDPYSSQFLRDKKSSLRFMEGVFGLCVVLVLMLLIVKLLYHPQVISEAPIASWGILLALIPMATATLFLHKIAYIEMEKVVKRIKSARATSSNSSLSSDAEAQTK